ncbi:hypothetical protein EDD16DRAFT_1720995 [Pisolithus croceorrhizus]|nr:hypothetical protein EDD16DRAFT_1720995 [Pisolithus croceorrhizus]KAI6096518.1 hypothetical protein EV401DRAFT_2083029 [Pisolithus croceorrhizus]KAI6150197.1 hypothetical protein EDD17DRAFT_1765838 [Pisolithus thermaeus]
MLTNVVGFVNMPPIKTVIDETKTFAEYLGEFKNALIGVKAYEDIATKGRSSFAGHGYSKHLFAPGGMNMETISQLESNRLSAKVIIPLYNDEEQYEFLLTVHLRSSHVTLRFDSHIYTERAASPVLGCLHLAEHERLVKDLLSSLEVTAKETLLHLFVEAQADTTADLIQEGLRHGDVVSLCFDRGTNQILECTCDLEHRRNLRAPGPRRPHPMQGCGAGAPPPTSGPSGVFQKSLALKVLIVYFDDTIYRKRLNKFSGDDSAVEALSADNLVCIMQVQSVWLEFNGTDKKFEFTNGSTRKSKDVVTEHRSVSDILILITGTISKST